MSYPSRGPEWERVRGLEDAIAILEAVDGRRRVIREHAWHQSGNWGQVYAEATRMKKDIERLKELLVSRWEELFERAQNQEEAEP
jgi:hypothetical protein